MLSFSYPDICEAIITSLVELGLDRLKTLLTDSVINTGKYAFPFIVDVSIY